MFLVRISVRIQNTYLNRTLQGKLYTFRNVLLKSSSSATYTTSNTQPETIIWSESIVYIILITTYTGKHKNHILS